MAIGKQADIALFRLNEIQFAGANEPLTALINCGARRADRVFVAGKELVKDGQLTHVDLDRLIFDQNQFAKALT